MCGIVGIIGQLANEALVSKMLEEQKHRGPDFTGKLVNEKQYAFGHNRLSIIDLSSEANQPFESKCGRYILIFNGEIYNYIELRDNLKSEFYFYTNSDTEVLLNSYIKWGKQCLNKFNGMFAFAIWDKKEQTLFAARDRFGVKPFHYTLFQNTFLFASEINPLLSVTQREMNEVAWANYFSYGTYGNPDETFWKNIYQLKAGHYLEFDNKSLKLVKWYDFVENINTLENINQKNEEEYITYLLNKAIELRFRADVPIGFNISGGLDSSVLLGLINHKFNQKNIETFSFYTNDERYDEVYWVEKMLETTSFPLNKCLLKATEVPAKAKLIAQLQSEPYGGLPTIAYSQVFKTASQKGVKVLLDGQGSDESWAGYDYYLNNNNSVIQGVNNSPFKTNVLDKDFFSLKEKPKFEEPFDNKLQNLQYRDLFFTKIPRALRFNDRISMMYGTELREPFLDYKLVEYVFSRSDEFKIKDGQQKWFLRKIAAKYLNNDIAYAPKRPLQTPQREWLANELKEWVIEEISKLKKHPWFNSNELEKELNSYFTGSQENSFYIWQWLNTSLLIK